jgi:hypothetical protein
MLIWAQQKMSKRDCKEKRTAKADNGTVQAQQQRDSLYISACQRGEKESIRTTYNFPFSF